MLLMTLPYTFHLLPGNTLIPSNSFYISLHTAVGLNDSGKELIPELTLDIVIPYRDHPEPGKAIICPASQTVRDISDPFHFVAT